MTLPDPCTWFDHRYWGPGGVDISRWKGSELARGVKYRDHGPVTDGAKGAVRKLGGSRKSRGMSSDSERVR